MLNLAAYSRRSMSWKDPLNKKEPGPLGFIQRRNKKRRQASNGHWNCRQVFRAFPGNHPKPRIVDRHHSPGLGIPQKSSGASTGHSRLGLTINRLPDLYRLPNTGPNPRSGDMLTHLQFSDSILCRTFTKRFTASRITS